MAPAAAPVAPAAAEAAAPVAPAPAGEAAAPAEAAAAEARLAAHGVPSRHAPVVETAERARTEAGLAAWRRESAPRGRVDGRRPAPDATLESASAVEPTAANPPSVEPTAAKPSAVELAAAEPARATEAETPLIEDVAIHEGSAAGDEDIVVEDDGVAIPVASPVVKTPEEAAEEADVEVHEPNARSGDEQPRIPIPSRPGDDGRSVDHPRIVLRYVDDLRPR